MVERLSVKTKLGFGICDLGGNIFWMVAGFWLAHYLTDVVGLAAGLAGTAIMVGKIWDAVTDPTVGYLSDRTRHKWGRRRPWIFYGSFALFLMMVVMFTNPGLTDQTHLFIWASLAWVFLCTAYTLVGVPYYALTPEMTSDYNEQTSLNGYRMFFAILGILVSAGATLPIVGLFPNRNTGYIAMAVIYGAIMLITAQITFFSIREPEKKRPLATDGIFRSYRSAFGNKPFLLLMFPYALHIAATTILAGTAVYYFKYVYQAEGATTIGLLVYHVAMLICIPIWIKISKRTGKKLAYNIGMTITAGSIVCLFIWGHRLGLGFAYAVLFIAGAGYTTNLVMSWSTIPDTLEYDYARTGQRREGVYYGLWTFVFKLGQALAGGTIGWVLASFGYMAEVNTPETQFAIRLLIGPIPAGLMILGVVVHSFYPITKEKYARIMTKVREMEAAAQAG